MLFLNFITINSDKEVIITKFFIYHKIIKNFDLNKYYTGNLKYTEIEFEYSNFNFETKLENKDVYNNNMLSLIIISITNT